MKPSVPESFLYQPPSWLEQLRWEEVFYLSQEDQNTPPTIHVDLGAGDGGFIRARARNHPNTYFLAVERLLGRMRKIARHAARDSLQNIKVLRIEASYAVQHLFPPYSVTSMTILFPDPWPKRRHHSNRLIQLPFLDQCARCLRTDGWLGIKTDDVSYFEDIQKQLNACKNLKTWLEADSSHLLPEITDFEKDFLKAKCPIYFVAARPLHER